MRGGRVGSMVAILGVGAIVASSLGIAATGRGLRYTADSTDTIAWWQPWAPVCAGLVVALLLPAQRRRIADSPRPRRQAWALLACGAAFAVCLIALGPREPNYSVLKLGLLLGVPLGVFAVSRWRGDRWPNPVGRAGMRPIPVVAGYLAAYWALAGDRASFLTGMPVADAIVVLIGGFALNALLEEVFYRRWLLTRWRAMLGPWPAVAISAVVWAAWHVAIQGSGDLPYDVMNVLANHGVSGLFLGFLWLRYRVMWPLLVIHGVWNADPVQLLR